MIKRFTFVVAREIYEMGGELEMFYPAQYGTQESADKLLRLALETDPQYDWGIYKMVRE